MRLMELYTVRFRQIKVVLSTLEKWGDRLFHNDTKVA